MTTIQYNGYAKPFHIPFPFARLFGKETMESKYERTGIRLKLLTNCFEKSQRKKAAKPIERAQFETFYFASEFR